MTEKEILEGWKTRSENLKYFKFSLLVEVPSRVELLYTVLQTVT